MKLEQEAVEAFDLDDTYVPRGLRDGLTAFIEIGRPVGSFLYSVLCNDLKAAIFNADPVSSVHLPTIVRWLWNHAPVLAHGNEATVLTWMEVKQMDAMEEAR